MVCSSSGIPELSSPQTCCQACFYTLPPASSPALPRRALAIKPWTCPHCIRSSKLQLAIAVSNCSSGLLLGSSHLDKAWLVGCRSRSRFSYSIGRDQVDMALSFFGGRGNSVLDPFEISNAWDPYTSVFENSPSRVFVKDAHAVANTQMDWRETPEAHIFKADLPGLKKEEVKVQVVDGKTLEISGERKREEVHKGDTWHRVERSQGSFMRRFRLPENTNVDEVTAQAENGVLTVTIPKLQKPKQHVRQIEIA